MQKGTPMPDPVSYTREGAIALICIDNPPVNAASQAVRAGLMAALEHFAQDGQAAIAVLLAAGRTFVAGADITEFGKPPQPPQLPDVVNAIEAAQKPVLCVLHGTVLGGGLELALGAHHRLALPGTRMGLPEVALGILPGAGGTQRLPRLIGTGSALDMIATARQVVAPEALELGLVDALAENDDPRAAGLARAQALLDAGARPRRICDLPPPQIDRAAVARLREAVARRHKGEMAQVTAIDAMVEGAALPFDQALAHERQLFLKLMDSPQRAALVHAFMAERKASQLPDLRGQTPRPLGRIGILGGGAMGTGITVAALLAGLDVTLVERDSAAADRARVAVAHILDGSVQRGKITPDRRDTLMMDALWVVDSYAALAQVDLVIEAVFERMETKAHVFAQLDAYCKPGAVLATNTSYLDINALAATTRRPADVLGLHFFAPAHVMRLLEVVEGDATAPDVLATGFALAKRLGKVAVRAGVCDGFIGNRILLACRAAADHLVLDGASPWAVDAALRDFGFAMGPFQVQDLAGLDIGHATRQRRAATRDPRERVPRWSDVMVAQGWLGRKSGRGFYIYDDATPRGRPAPKVDALIVEERRQRGIAPRAFARDEIVARYMAAMVNEGARVVGDGTARRPLDVDVTLLHGYGFPRWLGGPMHWADAQGLSALLRQIEGFAKGDAFFWSPAPLLLDLVARGAPFDSLNRIDRVD